ncbi:MAG: helix-turn-helix domain-containing protein [Candidatus Dormibacteria bacterium]
MGLWNLVLGLCWLTGLVINGDELRHRLALRGRSFTEFAKLAGLSLPTVSHALAGRPVSPTTFRAICRALTADAPLPGSAELLAAAGQPGDKSAASSLHRELTATSGEDGHATATAPR